MPLSPLGERVARDGAFISRRGPVRGPCRALIVNNKVGQATRTPFTLPPSLMKILLVHNYYQQPGGEDVVYEQERQLLESLGHQVVTYERKNSELLSDSAFQRLFLPAKTIWARDTYREIRDLIRRERPRIAHVHNTFVQISPSVFAACREEGVPAVQTLHNFRLMCPGGNLFREGKVCEDCLESGLWQGVRHACYRDSYAATATTALMLTVHRAARTWLNDVTGYIALTEFSKRKFEAVGLPKEKIHVKPNFVAPDPGAQGRIWGLRCLRRTALTGKGSEDPIARLASASHSDSLAGHRRWSLTARTRTDGLSVQHIKHSFCGPADFW